MSQTVVNARNYWGTITALTSLVPLANVWVDVAGDKDARPYVLFTQADLPEVKYVFGTNRIVKTRIKVKAYSATLTGSGSVDAIISQVLASYVEQPNITPNQMGKGCLYRDLKEGVATEGGDYVAEITLILQESF
jgi:hypothetical protein